MRQNNIFKIIQKFPGISYNEIVREVNLSNGVVSHYLIKLLENHEIEKEGISRGKYFIKNIPKKDRILIAVLRNKTNNDLFRYLMNKSISDKNSTSREIAKIIQKSGSTVSVSLKVLQKNKIIERVIMNKNLKLTNDIGYKISNRKIWVNYIKKYNL